jgi:hypothetical protein
MTQEAASNRRDVEQLRGRLGEFRRTHAAMFSKPWATRPYSYLKAAMGSAFVARRAGM